MELKTRWSQSFGTESEAETVWQWIESAYSERHRAYHTLAHLEQCFKEFDSVGSDLTPTDRSIIELAIWFHDSVYQPHQSDNEEESVKLFRNAAGVLQLPTSVVEPVSNFILETKHAGPNPERSELCQMFLDIDLSILGQDQATYEQYATQVRQEYEWVPWEIYTVKRTEILERIRSWSPIYQTPALHKKYELQAKMNLSRAIANLTYKPLDPVC
jgi:predicted metal-dependent HD superfamily phosphohydrolase